VTGAVVFVALLVAPFLVMVLAFTGQFYRYAGWFARGILRRPSVAVPLVRSMLSPHTGSDWKFGRPHRMEADNAKAKLHIWGYNFSEEAHLLHEGREIELPKWEQYILNRGLRRRAKLLNAEWRAGLQAARQAALLKMAESYCEIYE
jgi:hypothetical protein